MPKVVDLDARRLEIASAAVTVIAHSGLEGARLRDVAAAAGVTTGAVTHYFLNKDEVLEAALAEVVRRYLARMSMDQDLQPGIEPLIDRISRYLPINERAQAEWRAGPAPKRALRNRAVLRFSQPRRRAGSTVRAGPCMRALHRVPSVQAS